MSAVAGRFVVVEIGNALRVLVENLSQKVRIDIRSAALPEPVRLHPVRVDDDHFQEGEPWVGTAMAALQTNAGELILGNRGHEYPIWFRLGLRSLTPPRRPGGLTMDPRVLDAWSLDPATAPTKKSRVTQQELDDAAKRITLGAREHLPLLEEFAARRDVAERLDHSPSLQEFLTKAANRSRRSTTGAEFCANQLQRVRDGAPTVELHRLILEGLGTPPTHESKYYSQIVLEQLDAARPTKHAPGGAGSGLLDLIPRVRSTWAFRPVQLRTYLGLER